MAEDDRGPSTGAESSQESPPASAAGFDSYRSLADSNIRIIVAKDVVPPFRFKAGGWELSQSSVELGPATKARIAEKGFFMFRVNEDQTGAIARSIFHPPRRPGPKLKANDGKHEFGSGI